MFKGIEEAVSFQSSKKHPFLPLRLKSISFVGFFPHKKAKIAFEGLWLLSCITKHFFPEVETTTSVFVSILLRRHQVTFRLVQKTFNCKREHEGPRKQRVRI